MRVLANILSVILHPLWFPVILIVYFIWSNPYYFFPLDTPEGVRFVMNLVRNVVLFPALALYIMHRLKLVKDLFLDSRRERLFPFLILMIFFFSAYFYYKNQPYPELISDVLLGASLSLLAAYIINVLYFKISLHAIGAGSLVAGVMYSMLFSYYSVAPFLMFAIFIAGLSGTARMLLAAHSLREVAAGYALGYVLQLWAFML